MEVIWQHAGDWLILLGLLGAGVLTLRAIRREASTFKDASFPYALNELIVPVPRWWTCTRQEPHQLQFERTDTRYDWYARFQWVPEIQERPLHEILAQKVEADELDYDKEDVAITTDPRVLFRHESARTRFTEALRVEGKASQRIEERIYLDLYLFRCPGSGGYFLCESRSSVLNGMVEGPFFEEALLEATC